MCASLTCQRQCQGGPPRYCAAFVGRSFVHTGVACVCVHRGVLVARRIFGKSTVVDPRTRLRRILASSPQPSEWWAAGIVVSSGVVPCVILPTRLLRLHGVVSPSHVYLYEDKATQVKSAGVRAHVFQVAGAVSVVVVVVSSRRKHFESSPLFG